MASGTITLDTPKSTVAGYIKWSGEASTATNNYSLVSASIYLKKTDGYTSWGDFSGKLIINGNSYSFSKNVTLGSSYVLIASKTGVKVNHDSDGSKKIAISTSFKIPDTTIAGTYSASKTVTLDTIKRLSYLTDSVDIKAGEDFTLNINRYSGSYVHDISIKADGITLREAKGYGEKVTFSSDSYQESLFTALAGSLSKACTVVLTTRSGDMVLGSNSYTGTITAPSPGNLILTLSSVYIGERQGVTVAQPCSGYDYTAVYQYVSGVTGPVSLSSSENLSGTLPIGEEFASQMPGDVDNAVCTICVTASYHGIQAGPALNMGFNVRLPESYKVIYFDENDASYGFLNEDLTGSSKKFINGAGTLQMTIPASSMASAVYQAKIEKYELRQGTKSVTAVSPFAAGDLILELTGGSGQAVELSITDSRGNCRCCTYHVSDVDFIDYTSFKLADSVIYRENGFDSTVKMHIEGTAWKGNFGRQDNSLHIRYQVRKAGSDAVYGPFEITGIPIDADGRFSATYVLNAGAGEGFDIDSAYEVQTETGDRVISVSKSASINSGIIGMYLKRNQDNYHVGINCKPEDDELEASSQKAGLSVKGGLELISTDDKISGIYTDTAGRLCVEPALGNLILTGGLYLPDGSRITVGSDTVPVAAQQGSNFVELNLGAYFLRMNWGTITVKVSETNTPVATALSYKAGFFTEAPFVTVAPRTGVIGSVVKGVSFYNNTADGCDIFVNRTNTTAFSVIWKAISITAD